MSSRQPAGGCAGLAHHDSEPSASWHGPGRHAAQHRSSAAHGARPVQLQRRCPARMRAPTWPCAPPSP
eukprot:2889205-Lingulodinium_polyedra.AAC.1